MIAQAAVALALAAQLLLCSLGYAQAGSDPRFYALPGVGVGPFWIGEPIDQAVWELVMLSSSQRVFLDQDGNLCIKDPQWCISTDDGVAKTPDYLAWVWTSNPRVALVVAGTSGSSGPATTSGLWATR